MDGIDTRTATQPQQGAETSEELLTFVVDDQHCGVDILRVQEIRGWESITRIPNTPEYVQGVLNLRGAIVPIIDLRMRLGLDTTEYGKKTVIVVLQVMGESDRIVGIVVDAVSDVVAVSDSSIQEPPEFGGQVDTRYLRGMATHEDSLVLILDVDRMLSAGLAAAEGLGNDGQQTNGTL